MALLQNLIVKFYSVKGGGGIFMYFNGWMCMLDPVCQDWLGDCLVAQRLKFLSMFRFSPMSQCNIAAQPVYTWQVCEGAILFYDPG